MTTADSWLWCFRAGVGLMLLAGLLFTMGFSTNHWHDDNTVNYGLWERCEGVHCSVHDEDDLQAYHIATQALQIIALFCFVIGPIVHYCIYISKKRKDTGWRTRVFDVMYTIGTVALIASVTIFGMEHSDSIDLSWSYRMSAASAPISTVAIILVIISRSKALAKFRFLTTKQSSRKKRKVGALVDSRSSTPQSYNGRRSVRSIILEKQAYQNKGMTSPRDGGSGKSPPINVNVTVVASPSPSGVAFSTESSKMPYPMPYGIHQQPYLPQEQGGYYTSGASSNPADAAAYTYANTFNSYDLDPSVTNVNPVPMSSQNPEEEASSKPRNTFGPSEKQRILNPNETTSPGLGPIRGIPSAPPPEDEFVESVNSPPSYMDAVGSQNITSSDSSGEGHSRTSVV